MLRFIGLAVVVWVALMYVLPIVLGTLAWLFFS